MREINADEIEKAVGELCIEACCRLSDDIYEALCRAQREEISAAGRDALADITANARIAREKTVPICQDTGMAVVFVQIGQEVHITGGSFTEAINRGVARGYTEGCLRASVVRSPFERINTGDNTPAVIHCEIVPGDKLTLTVCPKGAGSENKSRIKMLAPADGLTAAADFAVETVRLADAGACPPMIVGVGLGGNLEECALAAKKALCLPIDSRSGDKQVDEFADMLLSRINALGIGPAGLGGSTTALKVNVIALPTHIAQLPVAVNIGCHVTRHAQRVL